MKKETIVSTLVVVLPARTRRKLLTRDAVVYLPVLYRYSGEWGEDPGVRKSLPIRGTVTAIGTNRYGAVVVRVRLHSKCRLYKEPSLAEDRYVLVDASLILGIQIGETVVVGPFV